MLAREGVNVVDVFSVGDAAKALERLDRVSPLGGLALHKANPPFQQVQESG